MPYAVLIPRNSLSSFKQDRNVLVHVAEKDTMAPHSVEGSR